MFTHSKKIKVHVAAQVVVKKPKSLDDVVPLKKKKPKSLDDVAPLSFKKKGHDIGSTDKVSAATKAPVVSAAPVLFGKTLPLLSVSQTTVATTSQVQPPSPPSVPAPVAQMPVEELRKQSSNSYYPGLPAEERVARLLADGCTNEQIAMRLDMSLKAVMDLRKQVRTKALIQSPRDLFSSRLSDFNSAFDEALKLFNDTPDSEISYKILVEFMKTMRELVKDYNELEDPRELAQQITAQALRPLVQSVLSVIVSSMKATIKNVAPFLKEQERVMLTDSLTSGLRALQDSVNGEYNNSVTTLEKIFAVDLDTMKAHAKSKDKIEDPSQEQPIEAV